ncbi:MAG: Gfo/Idh/MocA family oxidoreductase [Verrucomicrobiae bacterium]|nr:Gfo/Idh/MocA family oxidoreductase [Verrucomicrobiae bacterium]
MKKLVIGLAGAGGIARDHANSLSRLPGVKGLAVFDPDRTRAEELAALHGGRSVGSLRELAAACNLLWICTPPFVRLAAVREACRQGIPIFCEKPLGLTIAECEAVRREVRAARIPFFMGQSGRYAAFGRKMKDLVEEGAIGRPWMAWSTRLGWLDPARSPAWRLDDRRGGGTLIEIGVHEIDFIRWTCGDFVRVSAEASSRGNFQHTVSAVGTLRGGRIARLDVSWADPRYLWQRGVEGEEGSLFFDDARVREIILHRAGKEPRVFRIENWKDERTGENIALRSQAREVVECLFSGRKPTVTIEDGAAAVTTALAMRKAARLGRTVAVPRK